MGSLRSKARMWLHETQGEVRLVVFIKLLEVPPAKYVVAGGGQYHCHALAGTGLSGRVEAGVGDSP